MDSGKKIKTIQKYLTVVIYYIGVTMINSCTYISVSSYNTEEDSFK